MDTSRRAVESYWRSRMIDAVTSDEDKALRLIKYAVGKSGSEFRREMQRNSVAVRNLNHYKGHPDPLKGDALNKAIRDTAHETISAIFSEENGTKPAAPESINRRIEGFGNTNFQVPSDDRKSFLSEVVDLGSASINQGISSFAQGHFPKKNENASSSYRGPNLHRSLTLENDSFRRYDPVKLGNDGNYGMPKNTSGGSWGHASG
ncbi:unnamed protein product [Cochlearia groenlandica]